MKDLFYLLSAVLELSFKYTVLFFLKVKNTILKYLTK